MFVIQRFHPSLCHDLFVARSKGDTGEVPVELQGGELHLHSHLCEYSNHNPDANGAACHWSRESGYVMLFISMVEMVLGEAICLPRDQSRPLSAE